jgi:hypothetical protein
MTLLANVLQGDKADLDLIQLALETLANVMTYQADNIEGKIYISLFFDYSNISSRTTEFTSGYYCSIYR